MRCSQSARSRRPSGSCSAPAFDALTQGLKERASSRRVTVEGQEFDSAPAAHKAALDAIAQQQAGNENARYALTIDGQRVTNKEAIADAIGSALGDHVAFEVKIGDQLFTQRTAAGRVAEIIRAP